MMKQRTTTRTMRGETAFFEAVSILMESLSPQQVGTKVALLCHAHQALQGPQVLKIQGGPKWAERAKSSKSSDKASELKWAKRGARGARPESETVLRVVVVCSQAKYTTINCKKA